MDFLGRTLLRLADKTDLTAVLTTDVGDRLLGAAYEPDAVEVGPVTGVAVRALELLPAVPDIRRLDVTSARLDDARRWESYGTLAAAARTAAADARLDVVLTTQARRADTIIGAVTADPLGDLTDLDRVDARIVAEDGALPGASALPARRFTALKTMLHERFTQPGDFNMDAFLAHRGIGTIDALLGYLSPPHYPERLALDLVVDGTLPAEITDYRVVAAIKIDDDPVAHLGTTLESVRVARAVLEQSTEPSLTPAGMRARTGLPFVLVFPETTLDDDDLPFPEGTNPTTTATRRSARVSELQRRLQPAGIALAPLTP